MNREEKIEDIKEKSKRIFDHYGAEAQHRQLAEECVELAQEALKSIRDDYDRKRRLEMEVADVLFMIMQIAQHYGFTEESILYHMNFKAQRQLDRIRWDAYKEAHKDDQCCDADKVTDSYGVEKCEGLINEDPLESTSTARDAKNTDSSRRKTDEV